MSFLEIDNRRAIIDRRAIAERLAGLSGKKAQAEAASILRGALEYGRAEVAKRLGIMNAGEPPAGTGPVLVKG